MAETDWTDDWGIIWRSELRALAEDRELQEAFRDATGRARAASPAWPKAAAVPPDAGGTAGAVARLERRVDELERRLALLDAAAP